MITKIEMFSPQPGVPVLPLGGFVPSMDPVHVFNVEGLGPVKAEISSTPFATGRGELYQGGSTGKRNIVFTLGLNPNWDDQTMSSLRQHLYRYFMPEEWVKMRFFSDHLPTCDIEGYVESFEPNIFSKDPEIQISVICPKPDFLEADATILTGRVDDGTIETVFDYVGTVETGLELRIDATPDNVLYLGNLTISNTAYAIPQVYVARDILINTSKYFKLSSVRNAKRVQNISLIDGTPTNLLAKITTESVWPVIKPGENVFTVAASEPDQAWTLAYFNRFGGL